MSTAAIVNEQQKISANAIYEEYIPLMKKTVWARKVDIAKDRDTIHRWMHLPHVAPYWNMSWSKDKIEQYLREAEAREGFDCYLACVADQPIAYFELYQPHADPVGETYDVQQGDLGVHVLIGEEKYQRRYIIRLSTMMMRLVFNHHPSTQRIIGEPDINNKQIQSVMKFLGFSWMANVQLPDKIGALHSLSKESFMKSHGLVLR